MSDRKLKYIGCLWMGICIALFTVPLYHWALGEFAGLVAIVLGLIFARIIYKYTIFGIKDDNPRKRRASSRSSTMVAKGRIYIDKFGRIFDPQDRQ